MAYIANETITTRQILSFPGGFVCLESHETVSFYTIHNQ